MLAHAEKTQFTLIFQVDLQAKQKNRVAGGGSQGVAIVSPLKSCTGEVRQTGPPSKTSMSLPLNKNKPFCPLPPDKKANLPPNMMMMTTFGPSNQTKGGDQGLRVNGNPVMVTSSRMVTSLDDKCTTVPVHHLDRFTCDQVSQEQQLCQQRLMLMMASQSGTYDESLEEGSEVFEDPPPGGTKDL